MRLSCSTSCLPKRPLAEALRGIRAAGFTAVELSAEQVEAAFGRRKEAAHGAQTLLGTHNLLLSSLTITPLAAESLDTLPANLDWIHRHLELARELGVSSAVIGAGNRRRQPLDLFMTGLEQAAPAAREFEVRLSIANRRGSRIEQLEDLRYVIGSAAIEHLGIAVDSGEFHSSAVNPCHVFREFPDRIGLVYLADRIGKRPVQLGQGEMNVPAIIEMARRSGYDGWLVVNGEPPEDEDPATFLGNARIILERFAGALP